MQPNLFIVGFQKCGSGALAELLSRHKDIIVSEPKETFAIVDSDFRHWNYNESVLNPSFNWGRFYSEYSGEKYMLEASVCNYYHNTSLEYISRVEGAKVIFVIREPVSRLKSLFKYQHGRIDGIPHRWNFEDFCSACYSDGEVLNSKNDLLEDVLNRGRYLKYINRWEDVVGKENVFVLRIECLEEELTLLFNWLNIDYNNNSGIKRVNESVAFRWPLLNKFLVGLKSLTPFKFDFLRSLYLKIGTKRAGILDVNEIVEARIRSYYKEEIDKFYTNRCESYS